jgi:hypothetical protein
MNTILDYNPETDMSAMHGFVAGILHWKLVTAYIDPNFQVHGKNLIVRKPTLCMIRFTKSVISPSS